MYLNPLESLKHIIYCKVLTVLIVRDGLHLILGTRKLHRFNTASLCLTPLL